MASKKKSVFDQLMRVGCQQEMGSDYLEQCMSFDVHLDKKVPLRYRLIALGFIKRYSLEQMDLKLMQNGCERLYSRNIWEASLMYAFLKEMSYDEWKKLGADTEEILEKQSLSSVWFRKSGVTYAELEEYVMQNSDLADLIMRTRHRTRELSGRLRSAANGNQAFHEFIFQNLSEFSVCREKARYYFCKYLYYFLKTKMDGFLIDMKNGVSVKSSPISGDMNVFVGMATQRRKKCTPEQMKNFMIHARISCGEIFDGFNEFYCGYVTVDWMEALLEYYGDFDHLPDDDQSYLAESLRHYNPEFEGLSDEKVLTAERYLLQEREKNLDEDYSLSGKTKGYQRGRQGENTIRKYIRGELDIDRVSLLFYLLYFGFYADLPEEYRINRERLSDILSECGYERLNEEDDLDKFVIHYLKSDDPNEYLKENVSAYALDEENFFLYKIFRASRSENETIRKLMRK